MDILLVMLACHPNEVVEVLLINQIIIIQQHILGLGSILDKVTFRHRIDWTELLTGVYLAIYMEDLAEFRCSY